VRLVQGGDEQHFSELYIRYFDRIYAYVASIVRNPYEAEDVTQEVFEKALAALPRYRIRTEVPLRAWLFRIARNTALRSIARRARSTAVDPSDLHKHLDADTAGAMKSASVAREHGWISDDRLARHYARLPLIQRQILTLALVYGLSNTEIAEALDRSPGNVRVLRSRAIASLRKRGVENSSRSPMRRCVRPSAVVSRRRLALAVDL
jgi:RNA polymerase sigma-70 factor (ECF subfamily)